MSTPVAQQSLGVRGVLRIPDFRRVFGAQFISDFGDALTNLAVLLVVNELTGSVAALALMAIMLAIPPLTIGVIAGAWVDRLEPRRVMIACDLVRAALVLGLVVVHSADQVWILYLLGFLTAAAGTFFRPARTKLVSVVVPRHGLMAANSLAQGGRIVAMVLGSGAAGVMVSLSATYWPAFVVDSLTFLVSFALLIRVRTRIADAQDATAPHTTSRSLTGEVRAGIAAVASSAVLTAALVAATAVMLGVGAVNVLFVPLLVNDLAVSPVWFGIIDGAQAVGMIVAAGFFAVRLASLPVGRVLVGGMLILAAITAALAAVGDAWHVVLLIFVAGLAVTPVEASFATLVQTGAALEVRGRVAGLLNSATSGASVASMAFAGVAGAALGARLVFVLCAAVIAVGALISLVLFRRTAGAPVEAPATATQTKGPEPVAAESRCAGPVRARRRAGAC